MSDDTLGQARRNGEVPFGAVLKEFRKNTGLTQEELAQKIEVSVTTVGYWEQGKHKSPRHKTLQKLVEALNLSDADRTVLIEVALGTQSHSHRTGRVRHALANSVAASHASETLRTNPIDRCEANDSDMSRGVEVEESGRGCAAGSDSEESIPHLPSVARTHLPLRHAPRRLAGRETELQQLNETWRRVVDDCRPRVSIVTLVAWGGVGKTSLLAKWMADLAANGWHGAEKVFDWSFYSQGTRDQGAASAEDFVREALTFFGDANLAESTASGPDKGARLAELVGQSRTLLVLDGLEPLQHPPGPLAGQLKDQALEALLDGLARQSRGLCVITTRERLTNQSASDPATLLEWPLERLSEEAGAELLYETGVRRAGAAHIDDQDEELRAASKELGGHALTLSLLGSFLTRAYGGDILRRSLVNFAEAERQFKFSDDAARTYGHAFKMMATYERWLAAERTNGPVQLAVLQLMGLFDRPADEGCLAALRVEPAIPGLTESLAGINDTDWNIATSQLAEARLLTVARPASDAEVSSLDAHPLVREYFANKLRTANLRTFQAGHLRLYEHLRDSTHESEHPQYRELQPLYHALGHGALASIHEQACDEIYWSRIQRGQQAYSTNKLGAVSADLGAMAYFFDKPWSHVAPGLSPKNQAWLFGEAASRLRAMGRLVEAVEPYQASLKVSRDREDWRYAALAASNLSEVQLTMGRVSQAISAGQQAVELADRGTEWDQSMKRRVTLADALHQAGRLNEALILFQTADRMQVKDQKHPFLYTLWGYRYCDFLLAPVERVAWKRFAAHWAHLNVKVTHAEVSRALEMCAKVRLRAQRAQEALREIHGEDAPPLDVAFDRITIGRALLYQALLDESAWRDPSLALARAREEINEAVTNLHQAGTRQHQPRGLLARAWVRFVQGDVTGCQSDLDEAWRIAARAVMRLFMADIQLYRALLLLEEESASAARDLIEKCAYRRRSDELKHAEVACHSVRG